MIAQIVLVESAAGEQGNAPGFEIARRDIVGRRGGALSDGQDVAVGLRIKGAVAADRAECLRSG